MLLAGGSLHDRLAGVSFAHQTHRRRWQPRVFPVSGLSRSIEEVSVLTRLRHSRRSGAGFTLVELLVVLAILGLLAGLVGPQVMKFLGSSKTKTAALQIEDLAATLDLYRLEIGNYPDSLEALVKDPGAANWNGPYLRKGQVPKDPWGNDYQYRAPGQNGPFDIWSLGADGSEGGDGEGSDIRFGADSA
jgi:general secretion pathway protein G